MKTKSVLKEVFILALALVAIALVLAIILYGYSPLRTTLPSKVEYATPENVSQEISSMSEAEGTTPVTITYELDETNINNSKKSGSYNSGRQNPFGDVKKPEENNTEDGESENTKDNKNNTTSTSNSSSTTSQSNSTNTTSYLPDTGTK